jgi:hypothetical protein
MSEIRVPTITPFELLVLHTIAVNGGSRGSRLARLAPLERFSPVKVFVAMAELSTKGLVHIQTRAAWTWVSPTRLGWAVTFAHTLRGERAA